MYIKNKNDYHPFLVFASFLFFGLGFSDFFRPPVITVHSQFHPSYIPKLIRAKVHVRNSEGRLHWSKMSFLKSLLKQNAVYQSNFQMSRQCLQWSDISYLTLQRFTVSIYIGGCLQSEDFQTFLHRHHVDCRMLIMICRKISSSTESSF